MNQTKIVRPEVQRHSSFEIGQLAGKGQCQPMKSGNLHSQRQILPLDIERTDLAVIGNAKDFRDLRSDTRGGAYRPGPGFWEA
jgi:hypothetical protein